MREIQILNLIKCGSGICNRCDQRLYLLTSRLFRLTKSLLAAVAWINSPVWSAGDLGSVEISLVYMTQVCRDRVEGEMILMY
jgi:hypothetical protein